MKRHCFAKRAFAVAVSAAMVVTCAPITHAVADEGVTPVDGVAVSSVQKDNQFLVMGAQIPVDSTTADKYGLTDQVDPAQSISALDVLVAQHNYYASQVQGDVADMLEVSEDGTITKAFGETGAFGIAIDGTRVAGDLATKAVSTTCAMDVFFYHAPSSASGVISDRYTHFNKEGEQVEKFDALSDHDIKLTVKGTLWAYEGGTEEAIEGAQLVVTNLGTKEVVEPEGCVTNAYGDVTFQISAPGSYAVSAYATSSAYAPITSPLVFIEVADGYVADEVEAIKAIGEVSLNNACKAAIEAAETGYAALSDAQKAQITNYSILLAARAKYDALAKDQDDVTSVMNQIAALTNESTVEEVQAVQLAYVALPTALKERVTNVRGMKIALNNTKVTLSKGLYDVAVDDSNPSKPIAQLIQVATNGEKASRFFIISKAQVSAAADGSMKVIITMSSRSYDAVAMCDSEGGIIPEDAEIIEAVEVPGVVDPESTVTSFEMPISSLDQVVAYSAHGTKWFNRAFVVNSASLTQVIDPETEAAIEAINAIGTVQYNAASKAAIEKATAAYEALTDAQKAFVSAEAVAALNQAAPKYDQLEKAAIAAEAAKYVTVTINKTKVTAKTIKAATRDNTTTVVLGKKVKKISKNAFKGTNVKKIVIKSKKLTKKSVKKAFKGSKIKTVKVPKKMYKAYKQFMVKKVVGKKVKVRK